MLYFAPQEMIDCLKALGYEVKEEPETHTHFSHVYYNGNKDFTEMVYAVYNRGVKMPYEWNINRKKHSQVEEVFNAELKLRIMRGFGVKI